jgi:hypothetical protein
MKYIVLSVLMLTSLNAYCQKISIGIQAGLVNNTQHFAMNDIFTNANGKSGSVIGIKAGIDGLGFKYGIGLQGGTTGYSYRSQQQLSEAGKGSYVYAYASKGRYTMPYIFVNRKFYIADESFLFLGATAGYINFRKETLTTGKVYQTGEEIDIAKVKVPNGTQANSVALGLQTGVCIHLLLGLSIEAEAGVRYIPVKRAYSDVNAAGTYLPHVEKKTFYLQIPLTLGLNYRF